MTKVSLFTSVHYIKPTSISEKTLSILSNYFYLGGQKVTVIEGNKVALESGNISWYTTALKVSSYIVLFPITFILFSINMALKQYYSFSVISSVDITETSSTSSSPATSPSSAPTIPTNPKKPAAKKGPTLPTIEEEIETDSDFGIKTAQAVNKLGQQSIPALKEENPFDSFEITVSGRDKVRFSSREEMKLKAQELTKIVNSEHIKREVKVPDYYLVTTQIEEFIKEIESNADIIKTRWSNIFYIIPKRAGESQKGQLIIRQYDNGVIEEVTQESDVKEWAFENWKGARIYPNGKIETGSFERFFLHAGTRKTKEDTTYRLPNKLVDCSDLDRGLIYDEIEGKKQLIFVQKKNAGFTFEYTQVNEELIPTLAKILQVKAHANIHHDYNLDSLTEVLSGAIDCNQFAKYLFDTNAIFSVNSYALKILLTIFKQKGIAINLREPHPVTKQTLLDYHSKSAMTLEFLLSMDPGLIERKDGVESPLVKALIAKNKKGASILVAAMKKQKVLLTSREKLFKKVAFSEGKVTLKALKGLSKEDQEIVYRLANTYTQLSLVKTMRTLGFNREGELLVHEGPSIFPSNMDALEMNDRLHEFLNNLRSQKLLLTESEYSKLGGHYMKKGNDIGRILGRDYIEKKALELGLKHVKVPKKIMVVEDCEKVNLQIDEYGSIAVSFDSESYEFNTKVTVYAEQIYKRSKPITSEEVKELLMLFEATGFSDINWNNIIVAEDGVYVIDTEFTNFWVHRFYFEQGRQYAEMAKIVHALDKEEQEPLVHMLNEKLKVYLEKEKELDEQYTIRAQEKMEALRKTGCIGGLSFSFDFKELFT